jgi:outer membrane protein TolC
MYRRLFLIGCFLAVLSGTANAAPDSLFQQYPQQMSLETAIQTSLANAPEIKIALLRVAKANKDVANAWAEVFPTISASGNYIRNMEIPVNFLPAEVFGGPAGTFIPVRFGTDNNWQTQLSVTQNLFKGEALVGISSAAIYKQVEEENQRAAAQGVVTATRSAYYALLLSMEQYNVQRDNVKRLERNLEDNRKRQKAGYLDEFYVLQLEVELKNEQPMLAQAENAVENAYRALNKVMGVPTGMRYRVVGDLLTFQISGDAGTNNRDLQEVSQLTPFTPVQGSTPGLEWKGLRGDLRILDASLDLKRQEITAYKSRYLPTVTAFYNYTWSAIQGGSPDLSAITSPNDQRVRSKTLGVSAQMTLFNGLKRNTVVQKAKIEQKELLERQTATERNAESEIVRAADAVLEATELLPAYDDAVATARRGYDIASSRFSKGLGSQIDVTNALLQLRRAELSRALGAFNYLNAKANYDLAVGSVPFIDSKK